MCVLSVIELVSVFSVRTKPMALWCMLPFNNGTLKAWAYHLLTLRLIKQ